MQQQVEAFKEFLSNAPVNWNTSESIRRFPISKGESVSCVLWHELFHITGRKVILQKKFEEGIFSDLRNLKPLSDSTLEDSRSHFLKFLYENQCIRTQKKQKVFYWFSVNHDKLFLDALERDLKREASNQPPCTVSNIMMPMNQSLELAQRHCLIPATAQAMLQQPKPFDNNSISRVSSPFHDNLLAFNPTIQSPSLHQPAPVHHFNILHPGSPPQGLVTPPTSHQTILDEFLSIGAPLQQKQHKLDEYSQSSSESSFYPRFDSPFQSIPSRFDSPNMYAQSLPSRFSSPQIHSSHLDSSPQLQYIDPNLNYNGSTDMAQMYEGMQTQMNINSQYYPRTDVGRISPFQLREGGGRVSPYPAPTRRSSMNDKLIDCPHGGCNRQFKRQEHLKKHYRDHQEGGMSTLGLSEFGFQGFGSFPQHEQELDPGLEYQLQSQQEFDVADMLRYDVGDYQNEVDVEFSSSVLPVVHNE